MRGLFSMVGLLIALAIVGLVIKHQLTAMGARKAAVASSSPVIGTPQQNQQLQKQVQDDVNKLMQNRAADLEQQQQPAETKP
jgi:hypothetical protein